MDATMRRIGALAAKDLADLFKNPTMLVVLLMPIGFMMLFRLVIGDTAADSGLTGAELAAVEGEFQKFLLGSGLCMSVGMVASMVLIYGIAEEKERHTLRTLMLANVGAGEDARCGGRGRRGVLRRRGGRPRAAARLPRPHRAGRRARGARVARARARLARPDDGGLLQRARAAAGPRAHLRDGERRRRRAR